MFSLPARGDAKLSDRSIRKENTPNAVKLNPRMVESFLQLKVGTKTKPLVGWLDWRALKPQLVRSTVYIQPLSRNGQGCFRPSQQPSPRRKERSSNSDPQQQVRTAQDGASTSERRHQSQSKGEDPARRWNRTDTPETSDHSYNAHAGYFL